MGISWFQRRLVSVYLDPRHEISSKNANWTLILRASLCRRLLVAARFFLSQKELTVKAADL